MTASANLESIFEIEISRLHGLALSRPLNDLEVKKLDMLTRAWKTYNSTQAEAKRSEDVPLTDDELLALARSDIKV